jgi:hypothetical protein
MVTDSPQRVCKKCIERMEQLKLFDGRKSTFDKALATIITFCEENKGEFEKWKKKNLK